MNLQVPEFANAIRFAFARQMTLQFKLGNNVYHHSWFGAVLFVRPLTYWLPFSRDAPIWALVDSIWRDGDLAWMLFGLEIKDMCICPEERAWHRQNSKHSQVSNSIAIMLTRQFPYMLLLSHPEFRFAVVRKRLQSLPAEQKNRQCHAERHPWHEYLNVYVLFIIFPQNWQDLGNPSSPGQFVSGKFFTATHAMVVDCHTFCQTVYLASVLGVKGLLHAQGSRQTKDQRLNYLSYLICPAVCSECNCACKPSHLACV